MYVCESVCLRISLSKIYIFETAKARHLHLFSLAVRLFFLYLPLCVFIFLIVLLYIYMYNIHIVKGTNITRGESGVISIRLFVPLSLFFFLSPFMHLILILVRIPIFYVRTLEKLTYTREIVCIKFDSDFAHTVEYVHTRLNISY